MSEQLVSFRELLLAANNTPKQDADVTAKQEYDNTLPVVIKLPEQKEPLQVSAQVNQYIKITRSTVSNRRQYSQYIDTSGETFSVFPIQPDVCNFPTDILSIVEGYTSTVSVSLVLPQPDASTIPSNMWCIAMASIKYGRKPFIVAGPFEGKGPYYFTIPQVSEGLNGKVNINNVLFLATKKEDKVVVERFGIHSGKFTYTMNVRDDANESTLCKWAFFAQAHKITGCESELGLSKVHVLIKEVEMAKCANRTNQTIYKTELLKLHDKLMKDKSQLAYNLHYGHSNPVYWRPYTPPVETRGINTSLINE